MDSKVIRRRKKRLHAEILEQMEFYFSNANLTRDKFLREYLSRSLYIPISVFLSFNRIKRLAVNVEDIVGAVRKSHFLQLNESNTAVCRRLTFTPKEDTESCTIYVEGIPFHSTEDIIRRTFSAYGTIDYVSLPRNRNTLLLHGFGFVEFRTPNMAHNALQAFGSLGRRIPSEHYPECSTYEDSFNEIPACSNSGLAASEECPMRDNASDPYVPAKRRISVDSSNRDAPPLKVTRFASGTCSPVAPLSGGDGNIASSTCSSQSQSAIDSSTVTSGVEVSTNSCTSSTVSATATTGSRSEITVNADSATTAAETATSCASEAVNGTADAAGRENDTMIAEGNSNGSSGSGSSSCRENVDLNAGEIGSAGHQALASQIRKRRRKVRRGRKHFPSFNEEDIDLLNLQIMPLSEWLLYRERYRSLQKEHFSVIKNNLRVAAVKSSVRRAEGALTGSAANIETGCVIALSCRSGAKPLANVGRSMLNHTVATYKRIPGVVYVDIGLDGVVTHLRFSTAKSAQSALSLDTLRDLQPTILVGDAEKKYLDFISDNRTRSDSQRRHSGKLRGKDKILKRLWNLTSRSDEGQISQSSSFV